MSEHNLLQQVALELAALRRDLASLHKDHGTRLSRVEVCERLGIHRNTLRTYLDERGFPAPSKDGKWLLSEVIEWESR